MFFNFTCSVFSSVGKLEIFYGGKLAGGMLSLQSNEIIVHSGALIDVSSGGYKSESGPGKGTTVSYLDNNGNHRYLYILTYTIFRPLVVDMLGTADKILRSVVPVRGTALWGQWMMQEVAVVITIQVERVDLVADFYRSIWVTA